MTAAVTKALAHWAATSRRLSDEERAMVAARHALLDWTGVALAGAGEQATRIIAADLLQDAPEGVCHLVGQSGRTNAPFAAMINGVASHVLDFDDINKAMRGHPSVTVIPAVLAMAGYLDTDCRALLEAIVIGTEAACHVGAMMGADHYEAGWHTTATVGTIGAAAGVSRLLGLDPQQTEMAIGIAATQAAGLKLMFGTMCKPLHAGKAAMNGLLAARWAAAGLDSAEDALEARFGFGPVLSTGFAAAPVPALPVETYAIEANVYKFHAACYYTHSAIEALRGLMHDHTPLLSTLAQIEVIVPQQHLKVIDIKSPKTGLEAKFSLSWLLASVLMGADTSDPRIFDTDPTDLRDLADIAAKISVLGGAFDSRTASTVCLRLDDGTELRRSLDVGFPQTDFRLQANLLSRKFLALASAVLGPNRADDMNSRILSLGSSTSARTFGAALSQVQPEPEQKAIS